MVGMLLRLLLRFLNLLWLMWVFVPAGASAAEDFLAPERAFRLEAERLDGRTLGVRYEIAPGYYLYRERLELLSEPAALEIAAVPLPPGERKFDETFQKELEVYHRQLAFSVDLGPLLQAAQAAEGGAVQVVLGSQGCADKGLCYPPRRQRLQLELERVGEVLSVRQVRLLPLEDALAGEAATGSLPIGGAPPDSGGGSDRFASALGSGSLWSVAAVFALAGLLLSFTPCVLPMVPILSSIIVGQGGGVSRLRGLALSLAYALGMALVYTGFGVAAGLAGEGLAAALQTPWVLGGFALLLALLSLSMFGVYALQLPVAWQSRLSEAGAGLRGGRLGAVFLMGGVSALIVGPCVAAPLAGALVYISRTHDVVLGGLALFSMAIGMSVPLLLVGLSAGALLPRAGAWMEAVKRVFGVLLLGVALWMVMPLLPAVGVMLGWGALALGLAAVLWSAVRPGRARWLVRGLAVALALLALVQWGGAASGGRDALSPLAHLGVGRVAGEPVHFRRVRTLAELEAAVREAGRPVMFDFYADWCVSCKEMERYTFTDARVRERLAGVLLLQVDVTANNSDDRELLRRFNLFGPPAILFFDAGGRELSDRRVIGFQDAPAFLASLERAGIR
ncbi:MAG: thioredoxin:protein disulfide reductase [Pseudomonadota bacterium]|nr:thioredoxin:protein disulfide reductase [Pseudomonadota bacterium]